MRYFMFLHLVLCWCIVSWIILPKKKKPSSNCNLSFHVKVLVSESARMSQIKDVISVKSKNGMPENSNEKVERVSSTIKLLAWIQHCEKWNPTLFYKKYFDKWYNHLLKDGISLLSVSGNSNLRFVQCSMEMLLSLFLHKM